MSITTAVIAELVAAGLEGQALIAACQRIEDAIRPARSSNAERQARYRKRKANSVTSNVTSVTNVTQKAPPFSPLSPTPPIPPISPQKQNISASALAELEKVLQSTELAQAVIDHRKAIRKPLTVHAAKLLAREFAKCADPASSAETMIQQGWQGFKADWSTEAIPRKAQYPHRENVVDVAKRLGWFDAEQDEDASHSVVELFPAITR